MAENQQHLEIEQALTALVKLMKALRFYPKGHPSLRNAIDECISAFQPMLTCQQDLVLQVRQDGFSLEGSTVGESNPALPDLAHRLAERRVNQLIFLPDLHPQDLLTLLDGLTMPAEEIYSLGGLPAYLNNHRVQTIWLNESSLEDARQKRQELEEQQEEELPRQDGNGQGPAEPEPSKLAQQLKEIIGRLSEDLDDEEYSSLTNRLLKLSPGYFEQSGLPGILRILPLFYGHSKQPERCASQRRIAADALDTLLTDEVAAQLLSQFRKTSLTPQQFQRLQQFIVAMGMRIAPFMVTALSEEEDAGVRKQFTALLGKMGQPLIDLLRETVHSSKWYLVRNAVTLLGDLRLKSGLDILEGLTRHEDQRVRRAVIRSLAMIGGDNAVPPLQELTRDPVIGLRRPAVKALGATRSADAVAPLLEIAQQFDFFGRNIEIRRDAVATLGALGDKTAIYPLLALAKRPNLLRLPNLEELRAEIILALAKLGDESLSSDFAQWQRSAHGAVQRAAEQSLAMLAKKQDDPATD